MKSCPTCKRTYPDDTLAFCLVDGSVLSAPFDPNADQSFKRRDPAITEVLPSPVRSADTVPSSQQPTMQNFPPVYGTLPGDTGPRTQSTSNRWIVVSIALVLVLIAGGIVALSLIMWLGSRNSNLSPAVSRSSDPPQTTPESTPTPRKLDLAGTWQGITDGDPATLVINSSEDDSYQGTEFISASVKIKIEVELQIDSVSGHVTLIENRLLEGDGYWNLGTNSGSLSADGRKMSGTATDTKGKKYSWSFSKDDR